MKPFDEIFEVMNELADEGNSFFVDSVAEYLSATPNNQQGMREWLEESFKDHDDSVMSVRDALLLMMFPAD